MEKILIISLLANILFYEIFANSDNKKTMVFSGIMIFICVCIESVLILALI